MTVHHELDARVTTLDAIKLAFDMSLEAPDTNYLFDFIRKHDVVVIDGATFGLIRGGSIDYADREAKIGLTIGSYRHFTLTLTSDF